MHFIYKLADIKKEFMKYCILILLIACSLVSFGQKKTDKILNEVRNQLELSENHWNSSQLSCKLITPDSETGFHLWFKDGKMKVEVNRAGQTVVYGTNGEEGWMQTEENITDIPPAKVYEVGKSINGVLFIGMNLYQYKENGATANLKSDKFELNDKQYFNITISYPDEPEHSKYLIEKKTYHLTLEETKQGNILYEDYQQVNENELPYKMIFQSKDGKTLGTIVYDQIFINAIIEDDVFNKL